MRKFAHGSSQPIEESELSTHPSANDLWRGIGGHFESFGQALCEFVDNSISNLEANHIDNRLTVVTLTELEDGNVAVSIEDNGSGIADLTPVMRIGDTSARQSPLNEHGFGLKHALAHANPDNDSWRIATRTGSDQKKGHFKLLEAPYSFSLRVRVLAADKTRWPGSFSGTGTWVYFECTETLFYTLRRGIQGKPGFIKCLDYLCEDLGFIYAGLIKDKKIAIKVVSEANNYAKVVEPVAPTWRDGFPISDRVSHDLGGGKLEITLDYGMIERGAYRRYYRANQATSGLEIRFNGRAMGSGLFQEVWSLEVHPQYNAFLAIVNLISPNRDALPRTVTSKTRPRDGDDKKDALIDWVKKVLPSPGSDELAPELTVEALVHMLAERKRTQIQSSIKKIKEGFKVFSRIKATVFADLYVSDGKEVLLYKAKKDMADLRDAYHLLLYWDGAVSDGYSPDAGVLVAAAFSPGIEKVFQIFNDMTDQGGRTYQFMTRTWNEEGIPYPRGTAGADSQR